MRITQKPGEVTLDMQRYIEDVVTDTFPGSIHHKYVTPAEPDLNKVVYEASVQKLGHDLRQDRARQTLPAVGHAAALLLHDGPPRRCPG
eukprot:6496354-Prymnesium_polylepis.1